jgi:hypothetical protein
VVFLRPSKQSPGYSLELGHDNFVSHLFRPIIRWTSYNLTLYKL